MAGYVIHLAIGEEYIRKHKNEIKDKEEFFEGTIAPDGTIDKIKTHYGDKKSIDSLKRFLKIKEKELNSDYTKGYFLHLFTDYIFYAKYFDGLPLYNDYDITNKIIIEKYNVNLPEKLKEYEKFMDGEPKYLKYDLLYQIINDITEYSIKEIIEKIMKGEYDEYKD